MYTYDIIQHTLLYIHTERLHLYEAELLGEAAFDNAFVGCVGVFHVASPVLHEQKDPENEVRSL